MVSRAVKLAYRGILLKKKKRKIINMNWRDQFIFSTDNSKISICSLRHVILEWNVLLKKGDFCWFCLFSDFLLNFSTGGQYMNDTEATLTWLDTVVCCPPLVL